MHSNRLKHLLVALLAVLALSAVAAASASAAFHRPIWRKAGAAITKNTKIKVNDNSDTSRLWTNGLGLVIVCKKDESKGTIENHENAAKEIEGLDTAAVTYEGCAGWSTTENAAKQIIQKEELTACTVSGGGGGAGVIIVPTTKSFLAYVPGREPGNRTRTGAGTTEAQVEVVDVFQPEKGVTEPFVKIAVTGASCAIKVTEENGKVLGSVIGMVKRAETEVIAGVTEIPASPNEEAIMNNVLFETHNAPTTGTGKVEQRYKEYELEGKKTADSLTYDAKEAALESTEQIELAPNAAIPFGPEPFGVHA